MPETRSYILVINPGSTSTKVAVFNRETPEFQKTLRHAAADLTECGSVMGQAGLRRHAVLDAAGEWGKPAGELKAVIGRGGLLKPLPSGIYHVNQAMLEDLRNCTYGEHASNLGALLAFEIAEQNHIPAYIADPVVVDEMDEIAKITGVPGIRRRSAFHALNQKAAGRRAAAELHKNYADANLVIAHLGGGITVAAHRTGKVVDVNDGLFGDGPMSAERAGRLPTGPLVDLCFSGSFRKDEIQRMLVGNGGFAAYFGTHDAVAIEQRIQGGDPQADLIYAACAYQVAKDIAACCAVLEGKMDAIVLTGGLAHSKLLVARILQRIDFLARIFVYPGEDEMSAMAEAVCRVFDGKEQAREYTT